VLDERLRRGKLSGKSKGRKKTRRRLSPELLAHRNEDWRISHDVGQIDPATGRLVRRPVAMIAVLEGVAERTVRHGIASARKRIAAVREAG
jgi:hypothetical protein